MKTARLFLVTSLLFTFLALNINAQDCSTSWLYTTPIPQNVGYLNAPVMVATQQYIYVVGGTEVNGIIGGPPLVGGYEYASINSDGTLGQWTSSSDVGGMYAPGGTIVGNNIYIAGGYVEIYEGWEGYETEYLSLCDMATISSNGSLSSVIQPSMNQTGSDFAMAYSNGYLYRIGFTTDVEYSKVSSDGSLEGWNYTSSLPVWWAGNKAFASNGYIYTLSLTTSLTACLTRAQQNSDGTLGTWQYVSDTLPEDGAIILSADNQLYLIGTGQTEYQPSIYKASFDPLTGIVGTFSLDPRPITNNISIEGCCASWPYLYIIGEDTTGAPVAIYTCDTMTQKDFEFVSSADTGEWVFESVSGTSTEPTMSWVSSYNGSTTGALRIQFTQANQGVKMTLFKAGWFGSISTDWYEMKAQVGSDDTVYPNDLYAVGILYNGAYTPPIDIVGHGLYSLASGWNYLYDFQQSYGGVSMYPQLTFKNNDVYPATMYLESVEVEPISSPGD